MKNKFSFWACCIIGLLYFSARWNYSDFNKQPIKVTTWDALGYYMYLPATIIYNDCTQLKWFSKIDSIYKVSGGERYQAMQQENGNFVFKYLGGVALLQLPFFAIAHTYTLLSGHYKADGFSPPYQYAVALGVLFYFLLALWLLRSFLLIYFEDTVVCWTLLSLTLASNLIQYVAIDGGMSHGYIFPLYVFILWATYKWHQKPQTIWAFAIGYIIGLATICRPTEAIMLFIPLLWETQNKTASQHKWQQVKQHKNHIYLAVSGGIIGILPQLIYWKITTDHFIFDVGSKWSFLSPFFRVLFGWEKGWFVYTPITLIFVSGLFFLKNFPFKKAVIVFSLLNIYIVISWFDWQYGGSYSTRALSQSYPVWALPLATFIQWAQNKKGRILFYTFCVYCIGVNLFQIGQYNQNIIHFRDMNKQYYQAVYLNPHPTPLTMSLLDTHDFLSDESNYKTTVLTTEKRPLPLNQHTTLIDSFLFLKKDDWLKCTLQLDNRKGLYGAVIKTNLDGVIHTFRMKNALTKERQMNKYVFYLKPEKTGKQKITLQISGQNFEGILNLFQISLLEKP